MQNLSIVIVCKNGVEVISQTLQSFQGLTDDIVVYDSGSTDGSQQKIKQFGAKLFEGSWDGFGETKNKANALAKYDWILSLDADEAIDDELKENLLNKNLLKDNVVFELKFKNFLGNKWLRFGEWGNDRHIRLFNRKYIRWNDAEVHETLILPKDTAVKSIDGYVLHKTAANETDFENKMRHYAQLNAEKYFIQGKKAGILKMYAATFFSFAKNYFFKLGFLDGKEGYACARINALYTFLKYRKITKLRSNRY